MKSKYVDEFGQLELKSSEDRLVKLIESEEWEDISAIVEMWLSWEMEVLVEDAPHDVIQTQGKCKVLRDFIAQIEGSIKERAQQNNSVEHIEE